MKRSFFQRLFSFRLSMRVRFLLIMAAEMLLVSLLSWGIVELLEWRFHITDTLIVAIWLLLFSAVLSSTLTNLLTLWFFGPTAKLGEAMKKVAGGDFSVRLEEKSLFPEIREIYGNFNRMTKELGATEILQTDFISNVSHEIKTPISSIQGYAALLQGESSDAERQEYVDKILLNTRRLSELVSNVLLLSKVDNQAISTGLHRYRLDEQIRQAIVMLEPAWEEKDILFDVELEEISFTGSETLMSHVWTNLIGNAVKFNDRGGLVRLRLYREGGRILCTVEDDGPGIPPAERTHVFDRFYQGDTSRRQQGSGLGLALARQILTAAGATIAVDDSPEDGCRFTVSLPDTP